MGANDFLMVADICFVFMLFKEERILIYWRILELGDFNEQLLVMGFIKHIQSVKA